jgi:hypothetical protein
MQLLDGVVPAAAGGDNLHGQVGRALHVHFSGEIEPGVDYSENETSGW